MVQCGFKVSRDLKEDDEGGTLGSLMYGIMDYFEEECPGYLEKGFHWMPFVNMEFHQSQYLSFCKSWLHGYSDGVKELMFTQSMIEKFRGFSVSQMETMKTAIVLQVYRDGDDSVWKRLEGENDRNAMFYFVYSVCCSIVFQTISFLEDIVSKDGNSIFNYQQFLNVTTRSIFSIELIFESRQDFMDSIERIIRQREFVLKRILQSSIVGLNNGSGLLLSSPSLSLSLEMMSRKPDVEDLDAIILEKKQWRISVRKLKEKRFGWSFSRLFSRSSWILSVPMLTAAIFMLSHYFLRSGNRVSINFH